jgi:putative FmdB family regulatory protein
MPTYTYQCQTCGVQFDKIQKFDDKPLTRCPECRKGKVRRVVQASAIVFKGSGWYKTDHRSSSTAPSTKTDAKAEKADSAEATGSNETSKPAKEAKETAPAKSDD